jgi:hypothetical protein
MFVFIFKQHCVEQIFDEKTNYVSKNNVFMDEFTHYIKQTFDSLDPLLSKNSSEGNNYSTLILLTR